MTDLPKTEIPTGDTPVIENPPVDNGLSTEGEGELDEKTKVGFQQLVAKKDQKIQESQRQLDEANRKLSAFEAAKREKELADMSEAERLKTELDEERQKRVRLELNSFVTAELTKRNLMSNPLAGDIIESPWMLRAVKSHLSGQPTWDETIEAVKEFLPAYLDTLVVPVGNATPNGELLPADGEPTPDPMPSERGEPTTTPGNKRIWTQREIAEVQKDSQKWLKYRADITLAYTEGRVI